MDNTVGGAIRTIEEIDHLIERLHLHRDEDSISQRDVLTIITILENVKCSILKATAYSPIDTLPDNT